MVLREHLTCRSGFEITPYLHIPTQLAYNIHVTVTLRYNTPRYNADWLQCGRSCLPIFRPPGENIC